MKAPARASVEAPAADIAEKKSGQRNNASEAQRKASSEDFYGVAVLCVAVGFLIPDSC